MKCLCHFSLFREEYYAVDDIFARSQNLLKDKPVDDDKMEDDDAEEKTDKELKGEKKKSRKHVTRFLDFKIFIIFICDHYVE